MISTKRHIIYSGVILLLLISQVAFSQTIEQFKSEADQNNPEIKSARVSVLITEEKINEAGSLPDTNFSIGYFVSEPETRTGPQTARFSV